MPTAERLRVLVITTAHPPLDGRIFWKQATSLAASGMIVAQAAPLRADAHGPHAAAGVDYIPLDAAPGRIARVRRLGEVARLLWRRRHDFDVWHVHDPELLVACAPIRLLWARRVRLVYDVHEDYAAAVMSREWIPAALRRPISWITVGIERTFARTCSLIVAATPKIAGNFRSAGDRVVTVRNYPLTIETEWSGSPRCARRARLRCVFVGGITSIRGAEQMIAAMHLVDPARFELILAGPFESDASREAIMAGAPENVSWLGVLPFNDVPDLLATADIGILCFLPEPNHVESMPTKLFEYLCAGLAVVASNFPSWREFVDGVGIQVNPTDPAAIARAIEELDNDHLLDEIRARALERSTSTYTWEAEAAVLVGRYSALARAADNAESSTASDG